jgi:hypothetical protein
VETIATADLSQIPAGRALEDLGDLDAVEFQVERIRTAPGMYDSEGGLQGCNSTSCECSPVSVSPGAGACAISTG